MLSLPWWRCAGHDSEERPKVTTYYAARLLRILPLYYTWVLLGAVMTGDWSSAGKAVTFQFIGFDMFAYGVVWWTLTTAMQFYLLLLPLAWWAWLAGG